MSYQRERYADDGTKMEDRDDLVNIDNTVDSRYLEFQGTH